MKEKTKLKVQSKKVTSLTVVRKKYSEQFKDQAIDRAAKEGVVQAAKDLGLRAALISSWKSKKKKKGTSIEDKQLQAGDLASLRREVNRLVLENAFLKKAAAYFAKEQK